MVDYDGLFWSKARNFRVPVVFLKRLSGLPIGCRRARFPFTEASKQL
jgi:hypothetical protein